MSPQLSCNVCGEKSKHTNYIRHLRTQKHRDNVILKLEEKASVSTAGTPQTKIKSKKRNSEDTYVCHWCKERFKINVAGTRNFADHLTSHRTRVKKVKKQKIVKKVFTCSFCGYTTSEFTKLDNHIRLHTGEKPYKCTYDQCEYAAARSNALKYHIDRVHKGVTFKCRFCTFSTLHKTSLKIHECGHTGEKKYVCAICGYRTAATSHFSHHKKMHLQKQNGRKQTTERPFECFYCDYRSDQKASLKSHERTHTGEKPFECRYCDFRASSSCAVSSHERTHKEEQPLKCSYCSFRAKRRDSLRIHEGIHVGL